MNHLLHVLLVVAASIFLTLITGLTGATFTGPILASVAYSAVTAVVIVALGVGSLIFARMKLGLMQAGRLIQMAIFWLLMWITLAITPANVVETTHGWLTSFVILGVIMAGAALTGGFKSSFKRSWLPKKMKQPTPKD